jgi:hypothetical protein
MSRPFRGELIAATSSGGTTGRPLLVCGSGSATAPKGLVRLASGGQMLDGGDEAVPFAHDEPVLDAGSPRSSCTAASLT